MADEVVTVADALARLSAGLSSTQKHSIGSFHEFILNIWSQSFERPELFDTWHVGVIAEDAERALADRKNYVAILPRFHFKSTLLGHAFSVWRLLTATRDMSILYLSYSDTMARYHISEINKTVNRNPILMDMLTARNSRAEFQFRYTVNSKPVEILHGGLFSFKRGMHVNGALIADDILRDPENPLQLGEINKIEDHFMTETMFIPNQTAPVIVLGTPMLPDDLLSKLQRDDRFISRVLPAFDPTPDRHVLMPSLYSEEWLLAQQNARPKSFASEFLLQPSFQTESYFNQEDISACEDSSLREFSVHKPYEKQENEQLFAGFDVGKKRHPSHLVIFSRIGDELRQLNQTWLDGWNYSDQIQFLNEVAQNFQLEKGYIDNTRGELEDRGLAQVWHPMVFTAKSKHTMAQVLEEFVHGGKLKLLKDQRQTQQIISVNNDLKAPVTPMGHGDAFFSIAMATQAAYETTIFKYATLGSATDWLDAVSPGETPEGRAKENGVDNKGVEERLDKMLNLKSVNPIEESTEHLNPSCAESVCRSSFWVMERKLCIYCGYRG
jgi:hypothetical protein|tara:strand:+ start:379 stop:2040 length:1662 start_codon:yes stop_codon:yes gene_type:complete